MQTSELLNELEALRKATKKRFIMLLEQYDGSTQAFTQIIKDTLCYHDASPSNLANAVNVNYGTIAAWIKGVCPSEIERRYEVIRLIGEFIKENRPRKNVQKRIYGNRDK